MRSVFDALNGRRLSRQTPAGGGGGGPPVKGGGGGGGGGGGLPYERGGDACRLA